jgi:hypothetical protein
LPEMALSVGLAAGHGTNRQHTQTLALFEVRIKGVAARGTVPPTSKRLPLSWRRC